MPGLGKTLMVKAASDTLGLSFKRIQFTPDLMPSDIIGTQVLTESDGHREFQFKPGPIFAHIVLGDEINRATPKTQSAVLEAMEEHQVTVFGTTYRLDPPYIVLATQNPIELEGTYPLPEAQMDRFHLQSRDGLAQARRAARNSQPHHRHRAHTDSAAVRARARAAGDRDISRRWCAK